MKMIKFAWIAATALLAGCVVTSVCPYYTQNDLVSEPAIVGDWTNADTAGETWRFEPAADSAYRLTLTETTKATVLETHLFRLQGQLFMDFFSLERDYHVIPAHYLLRVTSLAPTLRLSELDDIWLKELLNNKPGALHHHFVQVGDKPGEHRVVLTGDPAELQKFIREHLKTEKAWKDALELKRVSLSINTAQTKGTL